ncbi:YigZ family protein [Weissella soli]|uniref:YigZ family protein n=1 Tax=Weissella soli TaxID=155866 RepID=UPI003C742203
MTAPYITIAQSEYTYEQVIKKSRFIVSLMRVTDEAAAKAFIERISQANRKANHNVWTYLLGDRDEIQRYSDDGEPAGTAGVPMLEVLKNNGIHDVVAVQTRYFGGIKLGAGGLIRAYAGTMASAVATVGLVQRIERRQLTLTIEYAQYEPLKYWLESQAYSILDTEYATGVTLTVPVNTELVADFVQAVTDHLQGKVTVEVGAVNLFEIPYDKAVTAKTSSLK